MLNANELTCKQTLKLEKIRWKANKGNTRGGNRAGRSELVSTIFFSGKPIGKFTWAHFTWNETGFIFVQRTIIYGAPTTYKAVPGWHGKYKDTSFIKHTKMSEKTFLHIVEKSQSQNTVNIVLRSSMDLLYDYLTMVTHL